MKFCQTDGTPLVADTSQSSTSGDYDPYKTVLGNVPPSDQSDIDPMKTMLGTPPVDLPPPSPFGEPLPIQPKDSGLSSPSFGDLSSPQYGSSAPLQNEPKSASEPFNQFGQSGSGQFSDPPRVTPTYKEPETPFGQNLGQPSFQNADNWTPPPAPQGWGDQGLGQNTPFTPPVAATSFGVAAGEQNQTLAIVSLVCGILSLLCCGFLTGIPAIITGFIAKKKAEQEPNLYKGRGLALAGMIMGALSIVFTVLYLIYVVISAIAFR